MNTLKIIEEHICRFNDYPQRCECFIAGIKQILESEIERKRGKIVTAMAGIALDDDEEGWNLALEEDIAHLTNLLDNLK